MFRVSLFCLALLARGLVSQPVIQFNILDDGAIGDGLTDNTAAIRQTLSRATNYTLPCTVLVPAGDYWTGSLQIPSNVTLHLARHAILRASDHSKLYSCVPSTTSDTGPCDFPFLLIDHARNVRLEGEGLVEGGANHPPGHLVRDYQESSNIFMPTEWFLPNCTYFSCRPKLLVVRHSEFISIQDITIANSPLWTVTIVQSEQILIDNVTITGDHRWPNNDGIDLINTRHVLIRNSNISTGDDCIAIVSHGPSATYNITVENMDLQSTSAGIKISAFEPHATGDMHQMIFRNIRIKDSNRGICVAPRWGSGTISDLLFENMTIETRFYGLDWWGTAEPIHITGLSKAVDQPWTGSMRNITLRNIVATGEQGIIIRGNTSALRDIRLENVALTIARWSNHTEHPSHDYRPSQEPQMDWAPVDGIFAMDIQGFSLQQVTVEFQAPKQSYYGECWNFSNVTQMTQFDVQCRGSTPTSSGVKLAIHRWISLLMITGFIVIR